MQRISPLPFGGVIFCLPRIAVERAVQGPFACDAFVCLLLGLWKFLGVSLSPILELQCDSLVWVIYFTVNPVALSMW